MSKILYPRATAVAMKKATEAPLHIVFSDPEGKLPPVTRHYSNELIAKLGAWYHCKLVGFTKQAVLYTTEELKALK